MQALQGNSNNTMGLSLLKHLGRNLRNLYVLFLMIDEESR